MKEKFTLDWLNKELTAKIRTIREYKRDCGGVAGGPFIIEREDAILLLGRKEAKDIKSWSYSSGPVFTDEGKKYKKLFNITLLFVDADSYFDIVFTVPSTYINK